MKKDLLKIIFIVPLFLSGCAFISEKINLNPPVNPMISSNIGHGKKVALDVVDARADTSVGGRPSGYGPAAPIELGNDITQVTYDGVAEGLKQYGFDPVDYNGNENLSKKLTLRIVGLNYRPRAGVFSGHLSINGAIDGNAVNRGRVYEKIYRVENHQDIYVTPDTEEDAKNINKVFSDMINQVLADKALMRFLAE